LTFNYNLRAIQAIDKNFINLIRYKSLLERRAIVRAKIERFKSEEGISIILFPEIEQEFVETEIVRHEIAKDNRMFRVFSSLPSGPGSRGVRLQILKQ
jgi:hypothetical protein